MATLDEVLRLLPPDKRGLARDFAGYSMTWLPLAAGAAGTPATVTTQGDSDFIAMRLKLYATTNADPPVENATPQMTINLKVGDRSLFPDNVVHHVQNFAISVADRRGHVLEFPVYVPPNTTFNAMLTNLASATAYNVRLTVYGIRIYSMGRGASSL